MTPFLQLKQLKKHWDAEVPTIERLEIVNGANSD